MTKDEQTTITQCLILLKASYPRQQLSDETIDVYEMLLRDLDPDLLKAAVLQTITENKFFPSVAEIREKANELQMQAAGVPDAYEAWGLVQKCIQRRMEWRDLPETVRAAVEDISDLYELRRSTAPAADRARFLESYQATIKRETRRQNLLPETRQLLSLPAGGEA